MSKKHYHKGMLCQMNFHKWGESEANLVMEGKAGKLIARVCKRCGYKDGEGYFIADKETDATSSGTFPRNAIHNTDGFFNGQNGWTIIDGIKTPMTSKDIEKLNNSIGELTQDVRNNLGDFTEIFRGPDPAGANSLYCECEKGVWNKFGNHCSACKRDLKSPTNRPPA